MVRDQASLSEPPITYEDLKVRKLSQSSGAALHFQYTTISIQGCHVGLSLSLG